MHDGCHGWESSAGPQVLNYLKFYRDKLASHQADVNAAFDDCRVPIRIPPPPPSILTFITALIHIYYILCVVLSPKWSVGSGDQGSLGN